MQFWKGDVRLAMRTILFFDPPPGRPAFKEKEISIWAVQAI